MDKEVLFLDKIWSNEVFQRYYSYFWKWVGTLYKWLYMYTLSRMALVFKFDTNKENTIADLSTLVGSLPFSDLVSRPPGDRQ